MPDMSLEQAVDIVNSAAGRSKDIPLILIAKCEFEGHGIEFPMQPQDYNRAEEHGHPKVCPACRRKYRRSKRK